ncbi:hypothetical protein C2S52_023099 [Perilla frutescens var. hirtella]|nr:hypothetical protein C2S52_023099 [Perilla frutescens var. hirtella]
MGISRADQPSKDHAKRSLRNQVYHRKQETSRRIRHPQPPIPPSHCQRNTKASPRGSTYTQGVEDPSHWDNSLEFRPQRFLSEDGSGKGQLDARGQHYNLLPFGSGRRSCPGSGSSLALQLIQTTLVALIQFFEFKIEGGKDTVDMEEGSGISLPAQSDSNDVKRIFSDYGSWIIC